MCKARVINKVDIVNKIARSWRAQYYNETAGTWTTNTQLSGKYKTPQEVYEALLVPGVVEDDIQCIIGNDTWTRIICDACQCEVGAVVCIELPNQFSSFDLCLDCLNRFSALLEADTA